VGTGGNAVVVSGHSLRSLKQNRHKQPGKIARKRSRPTKGSKGHRRLNSARERSGPRPGPSARCGTCATRPPASSLTRTSPWAGARATCSWAPAQPAHERLGVWKRQKIPRLKGQDGRHFGVLWRRERHPIDMARSAPTDTADDVACLPAQAASSCAPRRRRRCQPKQQGLGPC
jgi:hypothetical protein